ncbi:hypothetical protein GCM10022381_18230 [Leifsonia kafniensis]|uniref:Uncharacterized protein n=1 Tax=Leifsonia kafniensis TaxID=475957 RepID=A0ABP7KI08_9MICO
MRARATQRELGHNGDRRRDLAEAVLDHELERLLIAELRMRGHKPGDRLIVGAWSANLEPDPMGGVKPPQRFVTGHGAIRSRPTVGDLRIIVSGKFADYPCTVECHELAAEFVRLNE